MSRSSILLGWASFNEAILRLMSLFDMQVLICLAALMVVKLTSLLVNMRLIQAIGSVNLRLGLLLEWQFSLLLRMNTSLDLKLDWLLIVVSIVLIHSQINWTVIILRNHDLITR